MKKLFLIISLLTFLFLTFFSLAEKQIPASFFSSPEIQSPGNWIKENQIQVYQNKVILNIDNPSWASFTNTNSMDPFLDEDSHAIEIQPSVPEQIQPGDIISYKTPYGIIIHRVLETGEDNNGPYFIVKGDNNQLKDPYKVRFNQIKGVLVAIIY